MPIRLTSAALCALLLAACNGGDPPAPEDEPISVVRVLPNLPLPPGGQVLQTERGGDAAQLLLSTPLAADSVVVFYRDMLSKPPFRLMNESTERAVTSFYVEQDGPPLWVTVEGLEAGGTLVRLTGAVAGDTAVKSPAPSGG